MYQGFITKIKEIRPHSNAERLELAVVFNETVVVGKGNHKVGDTILYFPTDGQLSLEYCEANNLLRKKDSNGVEIGGYMDASKRNVSAISLRGEHSYGLIMPLESLASFGDISSLKVGDTIDTFNGHIIAQKYIPRGTKVPSINTGARQMKKKKANEFPFFAEHIDTSQLIFSMSKFAPGDYICLTSKCHGTSQREALALRVSTPPRTLLQKLLRRPAKEQRTWEHVSGTRRTVREESKSDGFYGDRAFRDKWTDFFKGKLQKGEEIFVELVGFFAPNAPIMPSCSNAKTKDKAFIKQYGETTTFYYGCDPALGQSACYVYRMTKTDEDGNVIEYPWDLVKLRCEQMGVPTVPELERFIYTTEEDFLARVNSYLDVPDPVDPRHVAEGVVVRALNAPDFRVAKAKSFNFKVIEGIIKDVAEKPDMEEAEEGNE